MKKLCSIYLFLCFTHLVFAQNPSKITIQGSVQDTLGAELPFATVMLLNPKDSALLNFSQSNDKGVFTFKNVKNVHMTWVSSATCSLPSKSRLT